MVGHGRTGLGSCQVWGLVDPISVAEDSNFVTVGIV